MVNYSSPNDINRLLEEHGFSPRKRYGQNFLINAGARSTLVERSVRDHPKRVWEIGPGIGALSVELAARCRELTLFEIDEGFADILEEAFACEPYVRIERGDFVKTWREAWRRYGSPDVIVGNLPYNAAAKILLELVEHEMRARLVVTVQKEAADRILAEPGSPSYSSFSVICQSCFNATLIGTLNPGSFYPRPRVVSAMLELDPADRVLPVPRPFFLDACRCLFAARRKTIRNNLDRCALFEALGRDVLEDTLATAGIDPGARGESIGTDAIVGLVSLLYRAIL